MNKMIKLASVVAVTVALAQSLQAVPVTGSIGFSGVGVTFNTGTAATATAIATEKIAEKPWYLIAIPPYIVRLAHNCVVLFS